MSDEVVISQDTLGTLYPAEVELIHLIRTKYRYGSVTIETRDGRPTFLEQTIKRDKLG